ncbi:kelch-like protein 2 isoform X1 [Acyrthosiphon pisum]|uniref:BTB domain-containing protein n=1 Tax=Acyrthosiphon pisum TaxID=7029 RepID=A0A8R2JVL6_ACYPI|nr:kelch-like protein 2 isoform X1 [Acyrthosiphon pisum]
MDALQISSCESDLTKVLTFRAHKPTNFRNKGHSVRILENLQSLRKNEVLCDVRFKSDDGEIVTGHANVLMVASPYFRAMFTNFYENNRDLIYIRKLDSTILKLLVDYIYTGEIMVTKENVQDVITSSKGLAVRLCKWCMY